MPVAIELVVHSSQTAVQSQEAMQAGLLIAADVVCSIVFLKALLILSGMRRAIYIVRMIGCTTACTAAPSVY
jgi:hypothetical protein